MENRQDIVKTVINQAKEKHRVEMPVINRRIQMVAYLLAPILISLNQMDT